MTVYLEDRDPELASLTRRVWAFLAQQPHGAPMVEIEAEFGDEWGFKGYILAVSILIDNGLVTKWLRGTLNREAQTIEFGTWIYRAVGEDT